MKLRSGHDVRDADCARRECLALGTFEHRGATPSGSRSSGHRTKCCLTRAYRGCPQPIPAPTVPTRKRGS